MGSPWVRSGAVIDYYVRDSQGRIHKTGTFKPRLKRGDESQIKVPHLHRVSPDGSWLASYDPRKKRLSLRSISSSSHQVLGEQKNAGVTRPPDARLPSAPRLLRARVGNLAGRIRTFRWLGNGSALVFHTSTGLHLLRPDFTGRLKRVRARRILANRRSRHAGPIKDFRILPHGLIARAGERLYHVTIGNKVKARDITPSGYLVHQATILSRGRVAVALTDQDTYAGELWILEPDARGGPARVLDELLCGACMISNWAPGAKRITYSTFRGEVFRQAPSSENSWAFRRLDSVESIGEEMSLWSNRADDRIVATGRATVQMWDGDGNKLWTWKAPYSVISAHFEPDDQSVIITTREAVFSVRDSNHVSRLFSRDILPPADRDDLLFLEGAIPLADGSIAFSTIREKYRRIRIPY